MLTTIAQPTSDPVAPPAPTADDRRYFALAFCWADVVFELDADQTVHFASGATLPLLGREVADLAGQPLQDLVDPGDRVLVRQLFKLLARRGRVQDMVIRLRSPQGRSLALEVAGHTLGAREGRAFLALRCVNGGRQAEAPAEAGRDRESGLMNGDDFASAAADRLRQARDTGEDLELTLLSLPGLDGLRDVLGEDDWARLLDTVGTCLRANSADGDSAGRVAGDTFGFLHAGDLDVAGVEQEIRAAAEALNPDGHGLDVATATMTGGFGDIRDEDLVKGLVYTINQFRDSAGAGLSFQDLQGNLNQLLDQTVGSLTSFRELTRDDRFEIAFHPILDVASGHCHHYEALVRFNGDFEESPFRYITFAEETGLISEFDIAMARKAVHWLAQRPNGRESVAVNISGHSVADAEYVRQLLHLLEENRWLRDRLLFEITESARMADLDQANAFIQQVRHRGHPVCLDDFGAGAASFQYLSTLEVDVVKLDGSAVHNARKAPKGTAFLKGLTALCKSLKVQTIAEMVDSPDGLDFVRRCGVDFAQGFLFGKPSPRIDDFRQAGSLPVFGPVKKGLGY